MSKPYGEIIPDLVIDDRPAHYPVVNERSVRAAAGIMFLVGSAVVAYILITRDFLPFYVYISVMWVEFFLKVAFAPKYSIFGTLGNFFVRNLPPEYVGAVQKRFAWTLGLTLLTVIAALLLVFHIRGLPPLVLFGVCLYFMWMQAALGVCIGCTIYKALLERDIIKNPEERPACPGGACDIEEEGKR